MDYARFVAEGLPIGSGEAEGAIRHWIRRRLDVDRGRQDQAREGDRLRRWLAMRAAAEMARLDYETRCGTLMDASDVRAVVANAATTLRTRLELLPDQLAPQLAAQPDENTVRAILANEIEALLADLAAGFTSLQRSGAASAPATTH